MRKQSTIWIVMSHSSPPDSPNQKGTSATRIVKTAVIYDVGEDASRWGILKKDDFLRVATELKEQGIIEEIPDYETFYKGF